jgi:hypothetical protein
MQGRDRMRDTVTSEMDGSRQMTQQSPSFATKRPRTVATRWLSAVGAVICGLGMSPQAQPTRLALEDVRLSTRDKGAISLLACGRPLTKDDSLYAIRLLGSTQIYVTVTCAPFGLVSGLPSLKVASCNNVEGRWTCRVDGALRVDLEGREVTLSYNDRIDVPSVLEIARYVASIQSFNWRAVGANVAGHCYIGGGKPMPFDGEATFSIHCEHWAGIINKDCRDGRCRLRLMQWDEMIE